MEILIKNNYRKYGDTKIISPKVIRISTPTPQSVSREEYRDRIIQVSEILEDAGYNPVSQILGYILSEDPTYITNYKNARSLIRHIDRDELLNALVKNYLGV